MIVRVSEACEGGRADLTAGAPAVNDGGGDDDLTGQLLGERGRADWTRNLRIFFHHEKMNSSI